ncbi:MAG: TMEM175 family protein [Roseicyclus sp.]
MSDSSHTDGPLREAGTAPASRRVPGAVAGVRSYVPKERVAAIYDGIVAIAATLLVLEIGVTAAGDELSLSDVAASFRLIVHWLVSFTMIAVLWAEFHFIFAHSRRWDGGLLAMTFAHVAALSLVPFASGLVGEYPDSTAAALVFASVMAASGLLLTANAILLRGKPHLHEAADSPTHLSLRIRAQSGVYVAVAAISMLGAYLHHPTWGIVGWALCPLALALVLGPAARRMEIDDPT